LDDVRVWMTAPAGTRAHNVDPAITVTAHDRGARAYLSWRRVRVPQHTPWPIELQLAVHPPPRVSKAQAPPPAAPIDRRWYVLAAIVALAATIVRARGNALSRTRGWRARALVPLRAAPLRTLLIAASCVLGGWLGAAQPALALALLGAAIALTLDKRYARSAIESGWRTLRAHDLRRARRARASSWLGAWSWLDATTPCGLALLVSGWLLATTLPADALGLEAAVLLTPLWLVGTRVGRPDDALRMLPALLAERRQLQARGIASNVQMRPDPSGLPIELRLQRTAPAEQPLQQAA
jgi:hypothetical protein